MTLPTRRSGEDNLAQRRSGPGRAAGGRVPVAGPAREAFLAAYGTVPPDRELAARVLAVSLCASLADYAAAEDRPVLLREALAGLARAVQV